MTQDNSLAQKDDQDYQPQKTLSSVHFDNISKKLSKPDWQHENTKCRRNTLKQKDYNNPAA